MPDTPPLHPTRTALLVMDYQQGLVTRFAQAPALLERVTEAVAAVRTSGGHVGWVRVAFDDAEFDAIPAHSSMAAAVAGPGRRAGLHRDADATRIDARLAPRPGDLAVRKTRVGSFTTTDLDAQLRAVGITTLVLAGLSTSGVVLSTVREAIDRDYRTIVLRDACADPVPARHDALVDLIFPAYSTVITVAELPGLLGGAGSARPQK